jgi:hypothetical protein
MRCEMAANMRVDNMGITAGSTVSPTLATDGPFFETASHKATHVCTNRGEEERENISKRPIAR